MTTRECVANRIIELCRERNMTINGLARLSALPPSTLKNIVNGVSQNPGIVTIKKLCDGLEITLVEFSTQRSSGLWSRRSSNPAYDSGFCRNNSSSGDVIFSRLKSDLSHDIMVWPFNRRQNI